MILKTLWGCGRKFFGTNLLHHLQSNRKKIDYGILNKSIDLASLSLVYILLKFLIGDNIN